MQSKFAFKLYQLSFENWMSFKLYTMWKVSKYGVISGLYFPVSGLNTGKYGPEITSYLDTFHAVILTFFFREILNDFVHF